MLPDERDSGFGFEVGHRLGDGPGRTGRITTPHGVIETPAFVVVGTKATVKTVLPESVAQVGAQAVLANAYASICSLAPTSSRRQAGWAGS